MKRFRWRVLALAGLFSLALTLVAAELTLRLLGASYPVFWTVDEHVGLALRPGATGWFSDEGGAHVTINAHGMHDVPRDPARTPGLARVAVLGDSFMEALQVPREQGFCAQLEARLQKTEVLNFGCSGYGTAQELLALKHRVKPFRPDAVVLAVLTGNDLADNERALDRVLRRPYFVWQNDELVLDDAFRTAPYYQNRNRPVVDLFAAHSRVFQLANALRRRGIAGLAAGDARAPAPATKVTTAAAVVPLQQAGLDDRVYLEPTDELWKRIWRTTERLLLMARDEAKAQGARFGVMVISNGVDVHPDPGMREVYARSLGLRDLDYPSRRIETFLNQNGVPVLNLVPPLRDYAQRTGKYLHGFATPGAGHYNADGHAQAAALAAPWVSQLVR